MVRTLALIALLLIPAVSEACPGGATRARVHAGVHRLFHPFQARHAQCASATVVVSSFPVPQNPPPVPMAKPK